MATAKENNLKRARAIEMLLNAAAYLEGHYHLDREAIKILLLCSVRVVASHVYMKYGLRVDRNDDGQLILASESQYYATQDGRLIRLQSASA